MLDGAFSRLMDAWTGGVFLAGLALLAGADNFEIGILAALPFLAQVAQLPAVHLMARFQSRRGIVVAFCAASRALLAVLAGVILLGKVTPTILIVLLAVAAVFTVVATAAWNTWMRDLLEPRRLGRFFAARMQATTAVGAAALLAGAWFLDAWSAVGPATQAYALLYWAAAGAGFVSIAILARTPKGTPPALQPAQVQGATRAILRNLRAPGNPRIVLALGLLAVAVSTALPFTAVYLLRSLGFSFLAVTVLTLANLLAYILVLRAWGRFSDHYGNRPVMQLSTVLLALTMVGWGIEWPQGPGLYVHLLLLHVATGAAVAGLELTTSNLLLKTAPPGAAPAHLAAFGITRAAVAGVTTLTAAFVWREIGTGVLVQIPLWGDAAWGLRGFHFLAFASAAAALASLPIVARMAEPEVRHVSEMVRAMRREVQSMSSVAGLRAFAHAASFIAEALRAPERRKAKRSKP
ncbi:MAG: hypothetical protein QOD77_744 [Thermoplasmata archaeon]|nr:hypothetical protein [Thermoplasmata archaeon]